VGRPGLVPWLLGAAETLAGHRMLDRLIRGRLWIGLVAFALIGIVTLQLGLLKLNSGIGRALEREAVLQRENAALSIENSELTSGGRVESQAGTLGMRLGSVSGLHFLAANPRADVAHAAQRLNASVQSTSTGAAAAAGEASGAAGGEASSSSSASESGSEASGARSAEAGGSTGSSETSSSETSSGETSASGEAAPSRSATGPETSAEPSREASSEASAPSSAAATGESGGGTAAPGG
jgi:cell division protein FtsL